MQAAPQGGHPSVCVCLGGASNFTDTRGGGGRPPKRAPRIPPGAGRTKGPAGGEARGRRPAATGRSRSPGPAPSRPAPGARRLPAGEEPRSAPAASGALPDPFPGAPRLPSPPGRLRAISRGGSSLLPGGSRPTPVPPLPRPWPRRCWLLPGGALRAARLRLPPAPRRPGSGLGWAGLGCARRGALPASLLVPPVLSSPLPSCPVLSGCPPLLRAVGGGARRTGRRGKGEEGEREGRGGRGRSALGRPLPAPETHSSPLPSSPGRGRGGGAPGCGLGREGGREGRAGGLEGENGGWKASSGAGGLALAAEQHGLAAPPGAGCAPSAAPPGSGRALGDRRCPRCPPAPPEAAAIALFGGVSSAARPPSGLGARRAPALPGPGCEGAAGSGRGPCAEPRGRAQQGPQPRGRSLLLLSQCPPTWGAANGEGKSGTRGSAGR